MPLIPNDAAALTRQQLSALVDWTKRNRAEIDRALIEANRRPGPAPQTTPQPQPAAPKAPAASGWIIKRVE